MSDQVMLTSIDGPMLAEAFPSEYQSAAMSAGTQSERIQMEEVLRSDS
ncbi:hypothetical protein C8J45_11371 [Sphingomonas sp. PP-CE-3G-477]|nr:hypothetical protein [Sphingomonas sp. PP-CE-3G-477]PTQ60120.1 hypothetical protein C8J45_11371 [Sphingomonas sp. PP-CE-3G-477]